MKFKPRRNTKIRFPLCLLIRWCCTKPAKVGANDDGIWRRLVVIPFNAKITGASDIKNYADYLFDNAGGYIMSWMIEGAQKAIAADFKTKQPKVVEEAVKAYREDNDWAILRRMLRED